MTSDQPATGPAPGAETAPGPGTASDGSPAPEPAAPAVVVHGSATPEELAALVAVLTAASGGGGESPGDEGTSVWGAHAAAMRRPVGHGPGAWRTSLRS